MSIGIQDDWSQRELFRDELLEGETVQWVGQPDPSVIFSKADIFLVPFSLMWGGFALFWESMVLILVFKGQEVPIIFPLFGIPFVVAGLYFMFGRFFYKAWKKRRTYYAVTDKRILTLTLGRSRNVQATFIRDIPTVNKFIGRNGTGTIIFGNTNGMASMYANTGMEAMGGSHVYGMIAPAFYDLNGANAVCELVNRLRNQSESKEAS